MKREFITKIHKDAPFEEVIYFLIIKEGFGTETREEADAKIVSYDMDPKDGRYFRITVEELED